MNRANIASQNMPPLVVPAEDKQGQVSHPGNQISQVETQLGIIITDLTCTVNTGPPLKIQVRPRAEKLQHRQTMAKELTAFSMVPGDAAFGSVSAPALADTCTATSAPREINVGAQGATPA